MCRKTQLFFVHINQFQPHLISHLIHKFIKIALYHPAKSLLLQQFVYFIGAFLFFTFLLHAEIIIPLRRLWQAKINRGILFFFAPCNTMCYSENTKIVGGLAPMTKVFFVRHAQSQAQHTGGEATRPLTPAGLEDADAVLEFFRALPPDQVYCSPYRRSIQTIEATAQFWGRPILADDRLRERAAGPGGNNRELFAKRWADLDYCEPGGESLHGVQARNIEALEEVLEKHPNETILIGTHGTALSTILHYYDPSFDCEAFLRILNWMPYIVELDFNGTQCTAKTEHLHIEK